MFGLGLCVCVNKGWNGGKWKRERKGGSSWRGMVS